MNIDKKKKLKMVSIIVCITLLAGVVLNQAGILRITTADEATTWNGILPEADGQYKFSGGSGTASSPYNIATAQDLAYLSVNTNAGCYEKKVYFSLTNNLNLANQPKWEPIGTGQNPFYGVFDGGGHTIEGLLVTKQGESGLFGYTSKLSGEKSGAEISNLNVLGRIIGGGNYAGGIVGSCNSSTITDCTFKGSVYGSSWVGGIAGIASGSTTVINGCSTYAGEIQSSMQYVGGITGSLSSGKVINCTNRASVIMQAEQSGTKNSVAGGLVGFVSDARLINSYNAGRVQSDYYGGGIANGSHAMIYNCYNIGNVGGTGTIGDIAGSLDSSSLLTNVFYVATTIVPIQGTLPTIYNMSNVGKISRVNEPLTKASECDASMWTLGDDTALFEALGDYVTNNINTYDNIREWAIDTETVNSGFPILTKIVGHIHDLLGGSTIDYEATCTRPGQMSIKCSKCDHVTVQDLPVKAHDYQTQILVPATCTTTGESVDVCSMCDAKTNQKEIPAKGHTWEDYDLAATCTEDGYFVKKCSECHAEDEATRIVHTKLGHDYIHTVEPEACERNRIEIDTCSRGDSIVRIEVTGTALQHEWDAVSGVYVAATCLNEGGYVRTCQRGCGTQEIVSDYEPKAAHMHEFYKKVEPTCTESGYTVMRCSVCQKEEYDKKVDYVVPLGHDYEETIVEPTCKERGYTHHKCIRCNDQYDDAYVTTLQHQWVLDDEASVAPSCMASGKDVYKCKLCNETKTEVKASLGGHNYVVAPTLQVDPTCTKDGAVVEQCTRCDKTRESELIPKLGHDYHQETIPATCLVDGSVIQRCSRCDDYYRESSIPAFGHQEQTKVVSPTTTSMGYTLKDCSVCGTVLSESNYIAATPSATFDILNMTLILSDVEELMKYSLDGGETWLTAGVATDAGVTPEPEAKKSVQAVKVQATTAEGITAVVLKEEDLDVAKGIQVVRPGNDIKPLRDSEVQNIPLTMGALSIIISPEQPTAEDGTGTVQGVDETMEYRNENDKTWTSVTGTTIDNLAPGTYYIRRKATETSLASDSIMFVIAYKDVQPSESPTPTPSASPEPGSSDNPVGSDQPASPEPGQSQTPASAEPGQSQIPSSAKPGQSQAPSSAKPGQSQAPNASAPAQSQEEQNGNTSNDPGNNSGSINVPSGDNSNGTGSGDGGSSGDSNQNTPSGTNDDIIRNDVYYSSNGGSSSGTYSSSKVRSAKTGDSTEVAVWLVVASVAITAVACVTLKRRRDMEE